MKLGKITNKNFGFLLKVGIFESCAIVTGRAWSPTSSLKENTPKNAVAVQFRLILLWPCQVMGKVPTISINKTDGCHVYLSKSSLDCEIVSAKSSEMNVLIPTEGGDFVSGILWELENFESLLWNLPAALLGLGDAGAVLIKPCRECWLQWGEVCGVWRL